ncbi:MAG: IPT/TIG domain-containing protein [Bryobacteraceae bacterium]|jgi:hypothetical protein
MTKRSILATVLLSLSTCTLGVAAQPPTILSASINSGLNQVTINGTHLETATAAPTVTLDGAPLALVTHSPTQIVATGFPTLGTGTFQLKVTVGTLTGTFDVWNFALPFVASDNTGPIGFQIIENTNGGLGIYAIGGGPVCSSTPCLSGNGVFGIGGGATTGEGGIGVLGLGGELSGAGALGQAGGQFEGGGSVPGSGIEVHAGPGVYAIGGPSCCNGEAGDGIYAVPGPGPSDGMTYGLAGAFGGNVLVAGNLLKSGGSFVIDHPADPEHKYLYHSFVESPDMMNIYNGNVVTDASGRAMVTLPAWFETLNRDFRYQLTAIGQPAQAWVASKIANGQFTIKTDKPGVEVSWQVTGIRQDAWANAHRIPLEVEKSAGDQGHYLHPELFGHEGESGILELHHPQPRKMQP